MRDSSSGAGYFFTFGRYYVKDHLLLRLSRDIPAFDLPCGRIDGNLTRRKKHTPGYNPLGKEAGADYEQVVKTTCFLADMGDFAAFNEVYARYFTEKPARSCVIFFNIILHPPV